MLLKSQGTPIKGPPNRTPIKGPPNRTPIKGPPNRTPIKGPPNRIKGLTNIFSAAILIPSHDIPEPDNAVELRTVTPLT